MEFNIPINLADLLTGTHGYQVTDIINGKHLHAKLQEMKKSLRNDGVEFILQNFDVFYSILYNAESLKIDLIYAGYEIIEKAVNELIKSLNFLLDDKDSINEEVRVKYLAIIKMLLYLYTQIVLLIEVKNIAIRRSTLKTKKKSKEDEQYQVNKKTSILNFNNLLQLEINLFWDPPTIEDNIINITSDVCYQFLQDETIKSQKEILIELFSFLGYLIKNFNHSTTFIVRLVQLIKMCEHLLHCLPDGIKLLVESHNLKGLVHELIKEVTEWQTDEQFQDGQGAKNCSQILTKLATAMPQLMIPELLFLEKYLSSDSAPLRISVLNVITEVLLNVLASFELNEEQTESRATFLENLKEHVSDCTASVRAKAIQNIAKLQKENIIPLKLQNDFLEQIIPHFFDKFAIVRKAAVNCVQTFLSHNMYGSNLSRKAVNTELQECITSFSALKNQFRSFEMDKLEELQGKWDEIRTHLEPIIEAEIAADEDEDKENESEEEDVPRNPTELIRTALNEGKYREAFRMSKMAMARMDEWNNFRKEHDSEGEAVMYILMMRVIFMDVPKILNEIRNANNTYKMNLSEEDVKKIEELKNRIEYLVDCVKFLDLIDSCFAPAAELLESVVIGDMHEAIAFFVAAYQFNLDNAQQGVLSMIGIMQRNEQERKDLVVEAFKTIYLGSEVKEVNEFASGVVKRLIRLLKSIPLANIDHFEAIIGQWVAAGTISNVVIEMLWQYFTLRVPISDEDDIAATDLLKMAAMARRTIITRNVKLVSTVAFGERGDKSMRFLASACALLVVSGMEKIDITADAPPTKIKHDDVMFQDLSKILVKHFFERDDYYSKALHNGIQFIFVQSNKPEVNCNELLTNILNKFKETESESIEKFLLIRLCQLLGYAAINYLHYMNETVYKELKRRSNYHEKHNKKKRNGVNTTKRKNGRASGIRLSMKGDANESLNDSVLEGVQAQDADAEFVLDILEHHTIVGGYKKLAEILVDICKRHDIYHDEMVQNVAVVALIRFMLISSGFCEKHLQLLFTILERTEYFNVKKSIMIHLSDLLTRFPNVVERWTYKIYATLNSPSVEVRKVSFFVLSNLILREMVRAHSDISKLACCLVDESEEIKQLAKSFFLQLSYKDNNLYNVLPEIFTHLMSVDEIDDEQLRYIMKLLFEHIDKTKQMESLVDRLCVKFRLVDSIEQQRQIAYCLTLIQYNDKALRKLQENFPAYKNLVHDEAIYGCFKEIFETCNKQAVGKVDLKPIVQEIDSMLLSMFDLNNTGEGFVKPNVPVVKKLSRNQAAKKNNKKKNREEDEDEELEESVTEDSVLEVSRRSSRRRAQMRV